MPDEPVCIGDKITLSKYEKGASMFIVHVSIQVKPGDIDDFIDATLANAKSSIQEQGIIRFDFLQESDRPDHFMLVEVYRTKEDPARHKDTDHYKRWKETVTDMMAVPRTKQIYKPIFPGEDEWQ